MTNKEQNKLARKVKELPCYTKLINKRKTRKSEVINNAKTLLKVREMVYSGFESRIFSLPHQSVTLVRPGK